MDLIKGKTIILCLPGRTFSGEFMCNLIDFINQLQRLDAKILISQKYSPVVNHCRCLVAGANFNNGKLQKPFNGAEYDYMLWIDSDIIFSVQNFIDLLLFDKDIVSGWYPQPSMRNGSLVTPVVEKMDNDYFLKNGTYEFLTAQQVIDHKMPFCVDYNGFGFMLIKSGVFEKIEYPWFAPKYIKINDEISETTSEDTSFCIDARNVGFNIWVHPNVRVGHEKNIIL